MKNIKNSKKIFCITSILTIFVLVLCPLAISGIQDEKLIEESNVEDAELSSNQEPTVVTVSQDDPVVAESEPTNQDTGLSPIDNAASLAVGYVEAGMSRDDVITVLTTDLGYTDTEAKIAYSKASAQVSSAEDNTVSETVIEESIEEEAVPELAAKDRVNEGISKKPGRKFFRRSISRDREGNVTYKKIVTDEEKATVTEMLDEGYTTEQIAEGFYGNDYSSRDIIAVFQESDISASDTYNALNTTEISEAEEKAVSNKPRAKFKNSKSKLLNRIYKRQQAKYEQGIVDAKENAVTGLLKDMKAEGFDISGSLDGAMQDLKEVGLSADEAYDAVSSIALPNRPSAKFRKTKFFKKWNKNKEPHGDAEYALAASMLNAGYEKSEVHVAFEQHYTAEDTSAIMSEAELRVTNVQNTQTNVNSTDTIDNTNANSTDTIDNTNTEQDILQRQTNSIPI